MRVRALLRLVSLGVGGRLGVLRGRLVVFRVGGVHHGNGARAHRRGSPVGGYSNRAGLDRSRSARLCRGAFSFLTGLGRAASTER